RDPVRTPFPWASGTGRGFTTGTPWLRFGENLPSEGQRDDSGSMLSLYRGLLALRRAHAALALGGIEEVAAHGTVLTYTRSGGGGVGGGGVAGGWGWVWGVGWRRWGG